MSRQESLGTRDATRSRYETKPEMCHQNKSNHKNVCILKEEWLIQRVDEWQRQFIETLRRKRTISGSERRASQSPEKWLACSSIRLGTCCFIRGCCIIPAALLSILLLWIPLFHVLEGAALWQATVRTSYIVSILLCIMRHGCSSCGFLPFRWIRSLVLLQP